MENLLQSPLVLTKKYMHGLSLSNMEEGVSRKGSTLWKLCSRGWEFLKEHLYRIPRNGKIIRLWDDKIMGLRPINLDNNFAELWDRLKNHGNNNLTDISSWDVAGFWIDWSIPRSPDRFLPQVRLFLDVLIGLAPVHLRAKDKWSCSHSGVYTMSQGYANLHHHLPLQSLVLWNHIWDQFSLPKINFFTWLLMHRRIIMGDNLARRGIISPHRCPICCSA